MSRIRTVTYMFEKPSLFPTLLKLHLNGSGVSTFHALNKPWFHELNIATILDIGANAGQFALTINSVIPTAKIYSFEPIVECFEKLKKTMANVNTFSCFNLGIGEESGELLFERNDFTASSSFLKMTSLAQEEFPKTKNTQSISVKLEPLDSVTENLTIIEPLLIKIDTQGYEDRVLLGGEATIKRAKVVIIETSFVKLYEGQPLFDDIYNKLVSWGFSYSGALDQMYSPINGKCLQEDSVFIR
jgi:FkbM family methyltransferase